MSSNTTLPEEDIRSAFLAARVLYTAAARSWREGALPFDEVLVAFARLSRLTARCLRDASSDDEARRFYEAHVVGGLRDESRAHRLLEEVRPAPPQGRVLPFVEQGLGDLLVSREALRDLERRLADRLEAVQTPRYETEASHEDVKASILATEAFKEAVVSIGRREWTRETYDNLRGWTPRARDVAFELGYGPALDSERLAHRRFEIALGDSADEVFARLKRTAERLPPSAVALYVSAARGDVDRLTGDAARRLLNEHMTRLVERVECEHDILLETATMRQAERSVGARPLVELRALHRGVERAGQFVRAPVDLEQEPTELREIDKQLIPSPTR